MGDGGGGNGVGAEAVAIGEAEAVGALGGGGVLAPGAAFIGGNVDFAGLSVRGGRVRFDVDEEEEFAVGAGFERGKLPAAPAVLFGGAGGDEAGVPELDLHLSGKREGEEEKNGTQDWGHCTGYLN